MNDLNVFNLIMLLGSFQGFLICIFFIFNKYYKKHSTFYFILILFAVSLQNLSNGLIDIGLKYVEFYPLSWTLLLPVTLYLFVKLLLNPKYKFTNKIYGLIILFIIQILFKGVIFIIYLNDYNSIKMNLIKIRNINYAFEILAILLFVIILYKSIKELNLYEKSIRNNYSNLKDKSLLWLRNALYTISVLWILWTALFSYKISTGDLDNSFMYPCWIAMSLVTYWIAYSIYTNQALFSPIDFENINKKGNIPSKLSENANVHYLALLDLMKNEELYKNQDLSMNILSEKLGLSNGYLSKIINNKEKKNFFDFVNNYRIEDVKSKLKDKKFNHYSLFGLAIDAGFNSKSTFNYVFKKITGLTPSVYKDKHQN